MLVRVLEVWVDIFTTRPVEPTTATEVIAMCRENSEIECFGELEMGSEEYKGELGLVYIFPSYVPYQDEIDLGTALTFYRRPDKDFTVRK